MNQQFVDSVDDVKARKALRRVSQLIFDLALEASQEGGGPSMTRAELRAALADLRHLQGFLAHVLRESEESSLAAADQALSVLAGKLAGRLGAVAAEIEEALS